MSTSINNLHAKLKSLGAEAVLFNSSEFLPSVNLRYLSGFTGSDASLLITNSERHFFTDGRYDTQAQQEISGFQIHIQRDKFKKIVSLLKRLKIRNLAVEAPRISYAFGTELIKKTGVKLISLKRDYLEKFRILKTPEERNEIAKAAQIASDACGNLIAQGLSGKREFEVAAELENLFRTGGASGTAFDTIVASGERSALPHGTATSKKIKKGELVILDYGCSLASGYRSDETVTCIVGTPSQEQKKIYEAVHRAHDKALAAAKVGVKVVDLDKVARNEIDEAGYGKFFMHSLGHGLGLETHEPPYLSPKGRGVLQAGMVFTIEPGVYIQGVGGVRLESLVYLGSSAPDVLSGMEKKLIKVK